MLTEYRVYDPKRRPPDLADVLKPGQFTVFFSDVRSGAAVDADGRLRPAGGVATCMVFDSLAEAQAYCREQADRVLNLRCDIHDERCKGADALMSFVNPQNAGRLPSRSKSRRMMIIGIVLITPSPVLFLWDFLGHQFQLLWPSLLASNLLVVGLRFLHWGYMELENLRAQERAAAQAAGKARIDNPTS